MGFDERRLLTFLAHFRQHITFHLTILVSRKPIRVTELITAQVLMFVDELVNFFRQPVGFFGAEHGRDEKKPAEYNRHPVNQSHSTLTHVTEWPLLVASFFTEIEDLELEKDGNWESAESG